MSNRAERRRNQCVQQRGQQPSRKQRFSRADNLWSAFVVLSLIVPVLFVVWKLGVTAYAQAQVDEQPLRAQQVAVASAKHMNGHPPAAHQ